MTTVPTRDPAPDLLADALRQLADAAALVADHLDPQPSTTDPDQEGHPK
ncbi:hypothetical protein [Prauserella halophila]|nr:hypothetical protein [Prauserella halophila]MCP2234741.1 hypothetical protein [Prauserella halophila]